MTTETKTQVTILARDIQNKAAAVGHKLSKSAEFSKEVREFSERKDANATSAVHLALLLDKLIDDQTAVGMPEPGSVQSHKDKDTNQLVLNDNPDVYDDYDENGAKIKGSYYWDVARMLDVGREVETMQQALRDALKPEVDPSNPFAGKGEAEIKALKGTWASRKAAIKRAVTDGCQLNRCLVLATNLDGVEVTIMRDPNDVTKPISGTHSPIMVADCSNTPNARARVRFMSVPSFLALDPLKVDAAMVEKHKGQWQAYIATGTRGKKGTGETAKSTLAAGSSKYPPIKSDDLFYDWALTGANYFDVSSDEDHQAKQIAHVMKMMADPKTGEDVIEAVGDVCLGLDRVWHVIADRHAKIKLRKANADQPAEKAA